MVSILGYLREENIVHRDLKPANFLVDENFNIKIADFGSAKRASSSHLPLGKFDYASDVESVSSDRHQNTFE